MKTGNLLLFILSVFILSGCATAPDYLSNNTLMKNTVDVAAEKVFEVSSPKLNKNQQFILYNLNTPYNFKNPARVSLILEDKLISLFSLNRYNIAEPPLKNISLGRFPQTDYILGYRLKKYGISYNDSDDYRFIDRKSLVNMELVLTDAKTNKVIWSDNVSVEKTDSIERKHLKYVEEKDRTFKGYDFLGIQKPEYPLIDNTDSSGGQAFSDRFSIGYGSPETKKGNIIIEAEIEYSLLSRLDLGLNAAYFPFKLEKPAPSDGQDYTEEFSGSVLPLYLSAKVRVIDDPIIVPYISAGFGAYIFVGEIEKIGYEEELEWWEESNTTSSGSEITVGMNTGIGVKILLDRNLYLNIDGKYHQTGYDFGENLQSASVGISFNF